MYIDETFRCECGAVMLQKVAEPGKYELRCIHRGCTYRDVYRYVLMAEVPEARLADAPVESTQESLLKVG